MKTVGLIYASEGGNCERICQELCTLLGEEHVDLIEVDNAKKEDLEKYNNLILASSTSGVGELLVDWDDLYEQFDEVDFSNKTVALLGLGDQDSYPDSFCGCLSFFYEKLKDANIIGQTSIEGYIFDESDSVINGQFVGLVIDEVNQEDLTQSRLEAWALDLKEGMGL